MMMRLLQPQHQRRRLLLAPIVVIAILLSAGAATTTTTGGGGGDDAGNNNNNNKNDDNNIEILQYTALTNPMTLEPGEVTNTFHTISIPEGPITIYGFAAEVVEYNSLGNIISVPVSDAYLHHHVVASKHSSYANQATQYSPMKPKGTYKSVGFGAGTESRGTPQNFPSPTFGFTAVVGEKEWIANVHIINTRNMTDIDAHHCLECPCTSEDVRTETSINGNDGDGDEDSQSWDGCNEQLLQEENTVCSPQTYIGGLRCCENGERCLELDHLLQAYEGGGIDGGDGDMEDQTSSTYYLQYTLNYTIGVKEEIVRSLGLAACCDATGDRTNPGNIEYDIPKCDNENKDECIHTLKTVQMLHGDAQGPFGVFGPPPEDDSDQGGKDTYVDVVYMVGHLHRGGIDLKLYRGDYGGSDDETPPDDKLICASTPTYGTDPTNTPGNEEGYIVAMNPCRFDTPDGPLRMKTTEPVTIVARYNSTESHTGVMSLWYIAIADVVVEDGDDGKNKKGGGGEVKKEDQLIASSSSSPAKEEEHHHHHHHHRFTFVVVMVLAVTGIIGFVISTAHSNRRSGYSPVVDGNNGGGGFGTITV